MPEPGDFTGPFTDADFLAGSVVKFSDVGGTVAQDTDGVVLAEGRINGAAIVDDGGEEQRVLVPVWTERDHGREATTIYVDARNIVSIRPPERARPTMRAAVHASAPAPEVFSTEELATITLAVHQATRSATFRRDLDPLDVATADVLVHTVTGMPAVLVTLEDGRRFHLLVHPVPAP